MPARIRIELSEEARTGLSKKAKSGLSEQRAATRAKMVLMCADGMTTLEIASRLKVTRRLVSVWCKRFLERGVSGLEDMPGKGRKKNIGAEERVGIVAKACSVPTDGSTRWSIRKLAKALGRSRSFVHLVLRAADLKPRETRYWCGKSPGPEFKEKRAAVLGLYLSPPENALAICVDEKPQIQALDRTQPCLPMAEGKPKGMANTYKRNGTACLLAALSVRQGDITARCADSASAKEFLKFLKRLYAKHPGRELHIIADNLSTHKQADVKAWLESKKRVHMHFAPTHASWLNQIEIWFNIFTRDVVRGGVWPSKKALVDQIMLYIRNYTQRT